MGKRTNFPRRERDDYPTPWPAVVPLLRLLEPGTKFVEPCAGAGDLVGHLERAGHVCVAASDLPVDARTCELRDRARYDPSLPICRGALALSRTKSSPI